MKTASAILIAKILSAFATIPISAQIAPPPPVSSSPSIGPWIVGGIGLGVLSVMGRATVVSACENRELTSDEATLAFFIPFGWVFISDGALPNFFRNCTVGAHYGTVNLHERTNVFSKSKIKEPRAKAKSQP